MFPVIEAGINFSSSCILFFSTLFRRTEGTRFDHGSFNSLVLV